MKQLTTIVPGIFVVDTTYGRSVVEGSNIRSERYRAKRVHGERNFQEIRKATIGDLLTVKRQGGWLPIACRAEIEQIERDAAAYRASEGDDE